MLTKEEQHEIDEAIRIVPYKQAACIEALKIVQEHRRWISDESLADIAQYMEMSTAALDSVATFYNLIFRKPVGRHVILLCDSISCYVLGYEKLSAYIKQNLKIEYGGTSSDGRFTLLPNPCLGTCDHGPALMIDNDLYRDVTVEQLDNIFNKYE
ncbi:NADH-quinone oxidoreductase subunit NuoE [Pseudochryseolinea flava]|uniref:NADH-quinone oxidoreductase subunit NuoE n=1 Tax=Pseudochryseolinea flava TaxID=2059302 RepID=A0A364Y0V5_9BACT|nr:NADH-quinone oxidoreductase subunit NuoE [Pseudochryseolinea flava]RAW00305.1 NADH-quinone oxidoreductase subunit NuoE [Pseudochryseolinea flava]